MENTTSKLKQRTKGSTDNIARDYLLKQSEVKAYNNDPQLKKMRKKFGFLGVDCAFVVPV